MGAYIRYYFLSLATLIFFAPCTGALTVPCDDLPQLELALKNAIVPELRARLRPLLVSSRTTCSVNLRDWVSEPIAQLTDRKHKVDGLNCWGSTLYLRGLREHLYYAHDSEFTYVLEQACHPVQIPQAGDIGAIRQHHDDGRAEEVHAFLYLTPDYAISKHSYSYESELEITHPDKFFEAYGDDVTYFRCRRWRPPGVSRELIRFAERLERDYLVGAALKRNSQAELFYFPLIEILNGYFFSPGSSERGYAFRFFESSVWQYTYLYSGERTPDDGAEI